MAPDITNFETYTVALLGNVQAFILVAKNSQETKAQADATVSN